LLGFLGDFANRVALVPSISDCFRRLLCRFLCRF
jgi:hypothetical protein